MYIYICMYNIGPPPTFHHCESRVEKLNPGTFTSAAPTIDGAVCSSKNLKKGPQSKQQTPFIPRAALLEP